jgi:hypothetical protein
MGAVRDLIEDLSRRMAELEGGRTESLMQGPAVEMGLETLWGLDDDPAADPGMETRLDPDDDPSPGDDGHLSPADEPGSESQSAAVLAWLDDDEDGAPSLDR